MRGGIPEEGSCFSPLFPVPVGISPGGIPRDHPQTPGREKTRRGSAGAVGKRVAVGQGAPKL